MKKAEKIRPSGGATEAGTDAAPDPAAMPPSPAAEEAIGLVVVTHGDIGRAMLDALQHIVGPQEGVRNVAIAPADDMEARRAEILDAIGNVGGGRGVVVMTDMFGGTPSNLALSALSQEGVEVIAGVNLPMLIKFASIRASMPVAEAVATLQEAGRKYINVASHFLAEGDQA